MNKTFSFVLLLVIIVSSSLALRLPATPDLPASLKAPRAGAVVSIAEHNEIEVARVFGRVPACADAPEDLIRDIAEEARDTGLNPRVAASLVAIESSCSQFAVSQRGAVSYTQVMLRIWKDKYDVTGRYNMFNQRDNLHVGFSILADNIRGHGLEAGVQRYNGLGVGCDTCDSGYSHRVLQLAGAL